MALAKMELESWDPIFIEMISVESFNSFVESEISFLIGWHIRFVVVGLRMIFEGPFET